MFLKRKYKEKIKNKENRYGTLKKRRGNKLD
jgi:hypothetical protein